MGFLRLCLRFKLMTLWLLVQMPYHSSLGDSRAKAIKLSSGADLAGESVGGVHLPPPPPPWDDLQLSNTTGILY